MASPVHLAICLAYPDAYEVGMSNLGLQILYSALHELEGVVCERTYVPATDMADELRKEKIPLFSLESTTPVGDFDLLGISLQHELTYTNVLELLDLAGIPLRSGDRGEDDPLVVAGGPCVVDPEPMAPFFDAFLIGEADEAIVELADALVLAKQEGRGRAERLAALGALDGVYVPAYYETDPATGQLFPKGGAPARVKRRLVADLDAVPVPNRMIVPFVEVVHDRCSVEIMRGCTRGCRFCQASTIYRPVRERSRRTVARAAQELLSLTGYEELSLASLSTSDYTQIEELLRELKGYTGPRAIATSLPSLRADAFSIELAELVARVKRTGLTFAPEAATQRLREVVNKNVTEAQLMGTIERAFSAGWRRVKLYFMIGLPTETDEDVAAIGELVGRVLARAREVAGPKDRGAVKVSVTVSTFVPKALTPFQWEAQLPLAEVGRRQDILRAAVPRKGVQLSWHDPEMSRLEGLLARGDRRISDLVEAAWRDGARFDAWSEHFVPGRWWDAAAHLGLDVAALAERPRRLEDPLPWEHLDYGLETGFLLRERERALRGETTEDCRWGECSLCGVCQSYGVDNVLFGRASGAA